MLLDLQHCSVAFGTRRALTDLSLQVEPGEMLVLTGENGAGKTTLLRLMAGLLTPGEGTVWRREGMAIGYLPQYRRIDRQFPITTGEVVLSGLQCRRRVGKALSAEQKQYAAELLARLGLADLAARPIETLSGGQWQRTLIARALVSRPDLLLLDEPDTHLDSHADKWLFDLLQEALQRQTAIVLVTHRAEIFPLSRAVRILSVENGRLRECPVSDLDLSERD